MDRDPIELLENLKATSGTAELYHVTTFKGYRENKAGETQLITFELWDAGPSVSFGRYVIKATDEVGRLATGNGYDTVDGAMHGAHWNQLDNPPPKSAR